MCHLQIEFLAFGLPPLWEAKFGACECLDLSAKQEPSPKLYFEINTMEHPSTSMH